MKSLKFVLILLISIPVSAQYTIGDPLTGKPYKFQKYTDVRGTPFLFEDWLPGFAYTAAKVLYQDVKLKLDICDNVLFFNFRDEPYEFRDNIANFTLKPDPSDSSTFLSFKRGYSGDGIDADHFVQILAEGRITLLKKETKQISELNQINSGIVKSFTLVTKYFTLKQGEKVQAIRLTKNDVSAIVGSNQQVLDYVKQNDLSFKKEKDVVTIIKYYNSLPSSR